MYKPKESMRWRPRVSLPIKLREQCLNAVVDQLIKLGHKTTRNSREKKAIREYITINVPELLQKEILDMAVNRLVGVQNTLSLLHLFDPVRMAKERIDLLGPFRMGFGCYLKEGRLTWSQGSAKKFNLSVAQLDQLYNIILWSSPAGLSELVVSVAREALKSSKFPNILAKGRCLTKVVLLSGAENHIMRILGTNCPSLLHLDVSHSIRVTDQGLRNLLMKRPPRIKQNRRHSGGPGSMVDVEVLEQEYGNPYLQETNHCAQTLCHISLLGTAVTWEGCDYACKLMNFGYLYSSLPLVKIVRKKFTPEQSEEDLFFCRRTLSLRSDTCMDDERKTLVTSCLGSVLTSDDLDRAVIDHYLPKACNDEGQQQRYSHIYVRKIESFKLALHIKIDGSMITSLVLPWYSFTWKLEGLVSLDTLGLNFPNLKFLRARVRDIWHQLGEPFLPKLEICNVWSLNSTTGLSLLQNATGIKVFEFNNTQTLAIHDSFDELTDLTLEACLQSNKTLANSLEEFSVRPTNLSTRGLYALIKYCPNMKRIGDVESWKITTEEIAQYNKILDALRSQCVIAIMNFPPSSREQIQWI